MTLNNCLLATDLVTPTSKFNAARELGRDGPAVAELPGRRLDCELSFVKRRLSRGRFGVAVSCPPSPAGEFMLFTIDDDILN